MIYFPNKVDTLGTEIKMSLSLCKCHYWTSDHSYVSIKILVFNNNSILPYLSHIFL